LDTGQKTVINRRNPSQTNAPLVPPPSSKRAADSCVTLQQLMLPEHANALGNIHGGLVMKIVDEAGAIAAMRHAQRPCVTVAIDSMTFHSAVYVGELLSCVATVQYVGTSSIEVGVRVQAENVISGETTYTNSAYLVYVALDDEGRPAKVPELTVETDEERAAFQAAAERQRQRLARRGR
jgi:acyl-CoA hydrolase